MVESRKQLALNADENKGKGEPSFAAGGTAMEFSVENEEKAESSPTIKHKCSTLLHAPRAPDILYKYSEYTQRTYILLKYSNSFAYPQRPDILLQRHGLLLLS